MPALHRIHPTAVIAFLVLSTGLWLTGCASKPVTENIPPPPRIDQMAAAPLGGDAPQNMLDWAGTYQAVLPCQGCPSTAISVQLRDDHTAVVRERHLGSDIEKETAPSYSGPFRFDPPGGSLITLKQGDESAAYRFFVAEGWIEMRERASGAALPQSTLFRLRKTSQTQP